VKTQGFVIKLVDFARKYFKIEIILNYNCFRGATEHLLHNPNVQSASRLCQENRCLGMSEYILVKNLLPAIHVNTDQISQTT
jgi:hypothetical protein